VLVLFRKYILYLHELFFQRDMTYAIAHCTLSYGSDAVECDE